MAVPYKTRHRCNLLPWVSPQTSHSLKKLETLRRKYFSKPNDNIQLKITILEKSIESSTELDQANYETSLANRRNTSHLFKYFKSLRKSNPIPSSVNWGSVTAKTEFEQCHLFNDYFISVFSTDNVQFIEDRNHEIKIQDFDASEKKIIQILKQLDITKSRGDDELPPVLFRNSNISHSLAQLFYKIKQTGIFTDTWKVGRVSPFFKKGDRYDVSNYRPISLLDIPLKYSKNVFLTNSMSFSVHSSPHVSSVFRKKINNNTTYLLSG